MRSITALAFILCVLAAATSGFPCAAQTSGPEPEWKGAKILPPPAEIRSPFDMDAPASGRVNSIESLSAASMDAHDREVVGAALPLIDQRAALLGFDLGNGGWAYRQMLCPIFPAHVLLLYTRNNGAGDVSEFTAVVPRDGHGSVRIVPILRRSFSPYTPASSNSRTIAAYNAIRAHEHPGKKVDWLTASLCYAALAGAQVVLPPPVGAGTQGDTFTLQMNPLLQIGDGGAATVQFLDVERPQRPVEWALSFNQDGKLLTVALTPLKGFTPKLIEAPRQLQ